VNGRSVSTGSSCRRAGHAAGGLRPAGIQLPRQSLQPESEAVPRDLEALLESLGGAASHPPDPRSLSRSECGSLASRCFRLTSSKPRSRLARRGLHDEGPNLESVRILALNGHHDLPAVVQGLAARRYP
jgi:hypothetical protein